MTQIPIAHPETIVYVADWAELFVILNDTILSKSSLHTILVQEKGEEDPEPTFVDDVWVELSRRNDLYGDNPPFNYTDTSVESLISKDEYPEYVMCLLLSIFGNREDPTHTGTLFERLSGEAIKYYIDGRVLICGHGAGHTVEDIATLTNERFNREYTGNYNDRGLDVVAWKPFGDDRCGQVVILVQCAAGLHWKDKLGDLPIDAWNKYISWGYNPLKGFSLPAIVSNRDAFREHTYKGGIIFDRTRIYKNIYGNDIEPGLKAELTEWCENKIMSVA